MILLTCCSTDLHTQSSNRIHSAGMCSRMDFDRGIEFDDNIDLLFNRSTNDGSHDYVAQV